jgi:hypothetical protein
MPLTGKGNEIMSAMQKEYGAKKGESVFYASKNKGRISGVDSAMFPGEKAGEPYDPKKEAENRKQAAKERARNMEEAGRSRRKDSTTPNPGDPNLLALSDAARAMRDAAELLTKRCDAMEREDASMEKDREAYKGYLCKRELGGQWWHVSKDGHHITTQRTLEECKRQIDQIAS